MLHLVATPIGNLADITFRAVETLKNVDLILCEDTRTSGILLKKYDIKTPKKSFHLFNEKKMEGSIIQDLKSGKEIALISDAGTPGISDPGQRLIQRCHKEEIAVTSLPGACSPIVALTLTGFEMERFQFLGFLPKRPSKRKKALAEALAYPGATIFFESPHRIKKTLGEIAEMSPDCEIAVVREITKMYEECLLGKASDLLEKEIRGEITLIVNNCQNSI